MKQGYVYIMGNQRPTLYTGVTSNLVRRVYEHKNDLLPGFTRKYRLHQLLYYEILDDIRTAIVREKQIKDLNRAEKIALVRKMNPNLDDISQKIS